ESGLWAREATVHDHGDGQRTRRTSKQEKSGQFWRHPRGIVHITESGKTQLFEGEPSGVFCSVLRRLTGRTLYGMQISSSMTEIFLPFGVPHVYSSIMLSPCGQSISWLRTRWYPRPWQSLAERLPSPARRRPMRELRYFHAAPHRADSLGPRTPC